ncbi:hypothetical protein STTU_5551 [Streptomyces sp. Tu6071]|nr:hypothetical protein STTU_5551 [Streptomyces sp. Tu6071]
MAPSTGLSLSASEADLLGVRQHYSRRRRRGGSRTRFRPGNGGGRGRGRDGGGDGGADGAGTGR